MFTKAFWVAAVERACKGAAAAMLLVLGADVRNVLTVDWQQVLGWGAGGAVLSLLMSVASAGFGPTGSPSLVPDPGASAAADRHQVTA